REQCWLEWKPAGIPRTVVLRLLSRCNDYAPVAARLFTSDGELFGAWKPKRLLLQHEGRRGRSGAEYHLVTGPGAYMTHDALPAPVRSWTGEIPAELRQELID